MNEQQQSGPGEWYRMDAAEALEKLKSDPAQGLSSDEARRRLKEYGPNELIERGVKSVWRILWEQLTSTMVVILIIAAAISVAVGDLKDAVAILAIVLLNSLLGLSQEYRAEKAMAALKRLAAPSVKAVRGGHVQEMSSRELVPGDILLLESGNLVSADCRVLESVNLRAQEASLTGESEPVEKVSAALAAPGLAIGDRKNMVHMGTIITYGHGRALVTETGMRTQLGGIAEMIQTVGGEQTPLQRRLDQLGRGLALAAIALVIIVFALGVLRGEPLELMFLTALSLAVAAVPEGLPAVVTIALAIGAQRMLRRRALIRKLPAVETLGSVTVICSDKTGTLTENRMTVAILDVAGHRIDLAERLRDREADEQAKAIFSEHPAFALLVVGGALCNDALVEREDDSSPDDDRMKIRAVGDPTEGALLIAAARLGLWQPELNRALPRVAEVPFDSDRKRMTTVHSAAEQSYEPVEFVLSRVAGSPYIAFTKGAVDTLLDVSSKVWVDSVIEPLDDELRRRILDVNDGLAQEGFRVLGVAFKPVESLDEDGGESYYEQGLIFVGMFGMIDPPRPEVKDAVATCKSAGIRPIMITGDHPLTARFIARELGIDGGDRVMTGRDLDRLPMGELGDIVDRTAVYARVSPEHKLNIVKALQDKKQIVAMTGDGVNDAPALKKADIGIAMGIIGTDVSKEAADMVLLDDNFATIVSAVEEGRIIYDNVRKFIKYILTSNSGEIWVMLVASIAGLPLPLLPLQILWINLVTDGLPALALGLEPAERGVMRRRPYSPTENIFKRGMGRHIIWVGILLGLIPLGAGYWYFSAGESSWQTVLFTTLTISQMGHAMAIRSERDSLFTIGVFSNRPLIGAVALTFALQLAALYVPFFQNLLRLEPLGVRDFAICIALSVVVFWSVEAEKWIIRRKSRDSD
ncbi:MAG TPA: cation-translocating P-type ATPase [Blastocatellia bacterium]|nr:cation-translocating P-type ATPase [Blastocatellia bacterium]